jgi:hypothetical protein
MKTRKMSGLKSIKFTPTNEKKRSLVRLEFPEEQPPEAIEFALETSQMMYLLTGLQKLQAHHKIPIPESLRPKGPPSLTIVEIEEE